jgi:hypothetical protein
VAQAPTEPIQKFGFLGYSKLTNFVSLALFALRRFELARSLQLQALCRFATQSKRAHKAKMGRYASSVPV